VKLADLTPDEVSVELYHGPLDSRGDIVHPQIISMAPYGKGAEDVYEYRGTLEPGTSGRHGYTVRVLPKNPDLIAPHKEGLVLWP
jgi:starch phosphorylase